MYYIGVDLGGTNIAVGIVNETESFCGGAACLPVLTAKQISSSKIWPSFAKSSLPKRDFR